VDGGSISMLTIQIGWTTADCSYFI